MSSVLAWIDHCSEAAGRTVSWLVLVMVLLQIGLVLLRYVFGVSYIAANEGLLYTHGFLFLLAAGYTLKHNGHVRVDLFYSQANPRMRAKVNLAGSLFFLLPVCALILLAGIPFVEASCQSFEGSTEASGLPFKYLYKSAIIAFALLLMLQGIGEIFRSILVLTGKPVVDADQKLEL